MAFWVKTSDEGLWRLHIASPSVDAEKPGDAYAPLYNSVCKISGLEVQFYEIKPLNDQNPIALDAIAIRERYPGKSPLRYRGKRLGNVSIDEAYIYPTPEAHFQGFDEIKRQFPSAEAFTITLPVAGRNPTSLLKSVFPLVGKINDSEFEGMAPGTLFFVGPSASSGAPLAKLSFVYRPEGWNKLFRADSKTWEEVVQVSSGKTLYEPADFRPFSALKAPA